MSKTLTLPVRKARRTEPEEPFLYWSSLKGESYARLYLGNCIEVLRGMPENSIDSCCVDPPYGLEFMGKEWDRLGAGIERDAKSAGGYGKDSATNENAYAAARVRHGSMHKPVADREGGLWTERPIKRKRRESGESNNNPVDAYFDKPKPLYTAGKAAQDFHEAWAREVYRVLKPGAYLLAMGGSRTHHRLMSGIEDAGFEVRDCITWVMASGFPKSHNISKAIDAKLGAKREKIKETKNLKVFAFRGNNSRPYQEKAKADGYRIAVGDEPVTEEARKWQGFGTALKPACEFIVCARKPLEKGLTVASNVLKWGTGGLNIDASRIGSDLIKINGQGNVWVQAGREGKPSTPFIRQGRWPANLILSHAEECQLVGSRQTKAPGWHKTGADGSKGFQGSSTFRTRQMEPEEIKDRVGWGEGSSEEVWECVPWCPCALLNLQSGVKRSGGSLRSTGLEKEPSDRSTWATSFSRKNLGAPSTHIGDKGGASRFFLTLPYEPFYFTAKPSKRERDKGLDHLPEKDSVFWQTGNGTSGRPSSISEGRNTKRSNTHPTCKPVKLMKYLIKLCTPPGGTVLDPFVGSGTTGVAAVEEGFRFIGIDQEEEYVKDFASARIGHAIEHSRADFWDGIEE